MQQSQGGCSAHGQDHFGLNQRNLPRQIIGAMRHFQLTRIATRWGSALQCMGEVNVIACEAQGLQHVVKQLACGPGKTSPILIFFFAWRIAHNHPFGASQAIAQNSLLARLAQAAACAGANRRLQLGPIHAGNASWQIGHIHNGHRQQWRRHTDVFLRAGSHFLRNLRHGWRCFGHPNAHTHFRQHGALAFVKLKTRGVFVHCNSGFFHHGLSFERHAHHHRRLASGSPSRIVIFSHANLLEAKTFVQTQSGCIAFSHFKPQKFCALGLRPQAQ